MYDMYNKLPHFVYLKNEKYFINTDYRIFIKFEEEVQGINSKQVTYDCLNDFYYPAFSKIIDNGLLNEATDQFLWFYKCGKKDVEASKSSKKGNNKPTYSYKHDDMLIWGAYHDQFKIDLSTVELHWWKFKSMWLSLDSECQFSKIRGYRAYTGKDKELLELKEAYKLPPSDLEIENEKRKEQLFDELKK